MIVPTPDMVTPIAEEKRQHVRAEVARYLLCAQTLYGKTIDTIDVLFDLKGKAAGMYKVSQPKPLPKARSKWTTVIGNSLGVRDENPVRRVIRFNPWLFAKYPDDSWANTIPHEVAHYITDCLFGLRNIRPHGKEWRKVMQDFGAEPSLYAEYDLEGIPVRQVRRYGYQCACRRVSLSRYRHQQVVGGTQSYRCRDCLQLLSHVPV